MKISDAGGADPATAQNVSPGGSVGGSIGPALRRHLWLAAPVLAGAVLRLIGLGRQVVSGDELHALRAAVSIDFPAILYTYQLNDHCIPLSAFYRLVTLLGIPLSEAVLRPPVVLSGLLVLVLVPLWTVRVFGRRTAETLAWWLALSPLLIYYSRIVRSYMPIVLLGSAAIAFFVSWVRHRRRRDAIGYALVGALAVYFHPVAGPFVCAPLVWLVLGQLARVRDLPRFRSTIGISIALVAAIAVFLIPASSSLVELVQGKRVENHLSVDTLLGVLTLQAGVFNRGFVVAFWILAIVGLTVILNRHRRLGLFSITLVVVQIIGVVVLSPVAMEQPNIFNRYVLICLPVVLIWVSRGLDFAILARLDGLGARGRVAATVVAAAMPLSFFFAGPLLERENIHGSFAHRAGFTAFFKPTREMPDLVIPAAYDWLSERRDGAVLEYPWHPFWRYMTVLSSYQQQHRRPVLVAIGDRTLWHPKIRLRNMVEPTPERILESRAVWLIIHLEIDDEVARADPPTVRLDSPGSRDRERRSQMLARMERFAGKLDRDLTDRWGDPDYRSREHVIWDLERVRNSSSGSVAEIAE